MLLTGTPSGQTIDTFNEYGTAESCSYACTSDSFDKQILAERQDLSNIGRRITYWFTYFLLLTPKWVTTN